MEFKWDIIKSSEFTLRFIKPLLKSCPVLTSDVFKNTTMKAVDGHIELGMRKVHMLQIKIKIFSGHEKNGKL